MERTYQYRLYPTPVQQKRFSQIADTTKALYNGMLTDRTKHFQKTGKWKQLDPAPFVKGSLLIKELDPTIINCTVFKLEKAYANFFHIRDTRLDRYRPEALQRKEENPLYQLMDSDLIGYPKQKKKSSKESWSIGASAVLITPNRINIPGIGNVKLKIHRPIPQDAKVLYYTLLKKASGHFFLHVHLELPDVEKKKELDNAIGIALEPGKLAQCSDGRPVIFRHQEPVTEQKIAQAYEALKRKRPGSAGYKKQRLYLATLYEKQVNQRRDSLHKISREIVQRSDLITMEEPAVQRKRKDLKKNGVFETVIDEAWWTFSAFLKYKSSSAGKWFWRAPEGVPVRFACSGCGVIREGVKTGAKWECPFCGAVMSSELNAARNLERLGRQQIEQINSLNRK